MIREFYLKWWREWKMSFIAIHSMLFFWILLIVILPMFITVTPHEYMMQEKIEHCVVQDEPHFAVIKAYDPFIEEYCIDVVNSFLANGSSIIDTHTDRRGDIFSYVIEK